MTTDQRNTLMCYSDLNIHSLEDQTRAQGLMIFNTDAMGDVGCLEFWNGRQWISLCVDRLLPALTVEPRALLFPQAGGAPQTVTVIITALPSWQVEVVSGTGGAVIGRPYWLDPLPAGARTEDNFFVNVPSANSTNDTRVATLRVTAGEFTEYVVVTQPGLGGGSGAPLQGTFVGAFWRYRQSGERLIRIPHATNNDWTAVVSHDWIILDTQQSADPNVWNLPNQPQPVRMYYQANDDVYRLNSATASGVVQGSGSEIYFRIGLTGAIPAGTHRYGQVILTHNNNQDTHIIWIRQGCAGDYLMNAGEGGAARPNAARFSPFNLTAQVAHFPDHTSINVGVRGGVFAVYPSRAGAHWQWGAAGGNTHAWTPLGGGTINTWPTVAFGNWNAATQETCRTGYRRPDGAEMRQSLFLNYPTIDTANSVWGYYADGWFDRHGRTATTPVGASQVRPQTSTVHGGVVVDGVFLGRAVEVAYIGRLFFNPYTNASIFFPASGSRNANPQATHHGVLSSPAMSGAFWSGPGIYQLWLSESNATVISRQNLTNGRLLGGSIRCVRE